MSRPRIGIVLGSSRPQRLGSRVCGFVMHRAADVPDADFQVLDLADFPLPFFDEPSAPLGNPGRTPSPRVLRWLDQMAAADGYLFLTPEYNHTIPAVLKNALDFLAEEAHGKPASILTYSSTRYGGNIAGNELRLILSKLGMLPLPKILSLPHADTLLDETGEFVEQSPWTDRLAAYLPQSLSELARYATALRPLRAG